jgi:hypothetical protein
MIIELPLWTDVCKTLSRENIENLKSITKKNVSLDIRENFDYHGDDFVVYVDRLPKRKFCEYLSKYYINNKTKRICRQILEK